VLFSTETEVYYGLNCVGRLIWELLPKESMTLEDLCVAVHKQFPDGELDQIRVDVIELLEDLARCDLVQFPDGP
jgi:hypothetical protein